MRASFKRGNRKRHKLNHHRDSHRHNRLPRNAITSSKGVTEPAGGKAKGSHHSAKSLNRYSFFAILSWSAACKIRKSYLTMHTTPQTHMGKLGTSKNVGGRRQGRFHTVCAEGLSQYLTTGHGQPASAFRSNSAKQAMVLLLHILRNGNSTSTTEYCKQCSYPYCPVFGRIAQTVFANPSDGIASNPCAMGGGRDQALEPGRHSLVHNGFFESTET
ncbi:hypothetical protein V8C37DRAFT_375479 [Trichoderma ceciliae]